MHSLPRGIKRSVATRPTMPLEDLGEVAERGFKNKNLEVCAVQGQIIKAMLPVNQ